METYVVLRRACWRLPEELEAAAERSQAETGFVPDRVRWLRSYVLAEANGCLGTACIFQAAGPEAIRAHAYRARLPVDEIVAVADTFVLRPNHQLRQGGLR